jgi:rod shape-determining protein MreC
MGGIFPAGYPVATINTVKRLPQEPFANVTAKPKANLNQVREIMLIVSNSESTVNGAATKTSDEER